MKKTIIIILLLIPSFLFAQNKVNEKRAIEKSHIDFSKEYLFFTLSGLIEIDGHAFKNDTCKCPIIYKSTLDGIDIVDTCANKHYDHRECKIKECKIIHLKIQEAQYNQEKSFFTAPNQLHF